MNAQDLLQLKTNKSSLNQNGKWNVICKNDPTPFRGELGVLRELGIAQRNQPVWTLTPLVPSRDFSLK